MTTVEKKFCPCTICCAEPYVHRTPRKMPNGAVLYPCAECNGNLDIEERDGQWDPQ